MKKATAFLLVFSLFAAHCVAQKDVNVLANSKIIGKNTLTSDPIQATEYSLPERIHDFQIDTVNNYLTIQLRGLSRNGKWLDNKGSIVRYDMDEKKVLWSKEISFQVAAIEQYGGITIHTDRGESYCLDNETGEPLWEVKNSIIFADPKARIGIGYKLQAKKARENMLEGIDLATGQILWEREISREYGWNDVFYLNDSTLLISASGLHTLNIFDGTGWDYTTVTGKKDYTASAVGTGLGIAAGLLTGTYAVSTGHDLLRDIVSNVIADSLNMYFASKEHLVKLTREGEVVWQKNLPADLTSKSWIFKNGENLIMVNRGYAYMGVRQTDFGTPFIASFDMVSGDQNYLVTVSDKKKEVIRGGDQMNGEVLFVYNDHVSKYATHDGQLIIDRPFNIEEYGELNYFVGDQVFIQVDSLFYSLAQVDFTRHYLYTNSGTVLALNSDFEIEGNIEYGDFYIGYLTKNDKKFIAKDNQTYVIDTEGKKIAEFSASARSAFLNGKLYNAQEKSFMEIDINDVVK